MITTTISSQNQITLPKFITNLLGINPGDKVLVRTEKDEVVLRPMGKSVVEDLGGSLVVAESKRGVPFDEVLAETKKKTAKKLVDK